jgi:hypothetical protein
MPDAAAEPMPGPLLIRIEPIAGEALMSLVTRAAVTNVLPSSHLILEQVGAAHAQNPTAAVASDLDEDELASILRIPVTQVALRRHHALAGNGTVDFFGVAVRADDIISRRRRFAPGSIGCSPHIRALWSIKTVPCCTESWQYLTDTCTCGSVQGWRHAWRLDRCDRCCARLDRIPTAEVDFRLKDPLGFLIGLLDPDPFRRAKARAALPPALADWDGGTAFELALAMLPLTPTGYRLHRGEAPPPAHGIRYATALAEAGDILRGWPSSLITALERGVSARSQSRVNVRYTGTADYIPALKSKVLPTAVRVAIEGALDTIRAEPGETPPCQIGMMEAADLMGRPLRILAPARREGRLRTRICLRAHRIFPTLDRKEVEYIHDFAANRRSAERVSDSLDLPSYAMTLIADEGLIALETHPYLTDHYGDPQLHKDEAERFRAALRNAALQPEEIAEPVPLHRVARAIGGGFKPWGAIVNALLNGSTPFCMAGDRTGRIMIGSRCAMIICGLDLRLTQPSKKAATCSQRDALEILNLPGKHSHLLKELAGADDDWEMEWGEVMRLAVSRITLTELSARASVHPTKVEARLEAAGCPRFDRFGWWRQEAVAALTHI